MNDIEIKKKILDFLLDLRKDNYFNDELWLQIKNYFEYKTKE